MEEVRAFLESSTIHGLAYVSTTRKHIKLFWILVIITGFIGAGVLIHQSFKAWDESPIKTTIETRPIREMTFPKVTVCPPKNTFTDLNYDLVTLKNMTLDNGTRNELSHYAVELLYDYLYKASMKNLSILEDNDRPYNWYQGYNDLSVPSSRKGYLETKVKTSAISGTISTKHFWEEFDAAKVEQKFYHQIDVTPPDAVKNNPNVTLHFDVKKILMTELSSGDGKDRFYISKCSQIIGRHASHVP